MQKKEKDIRVFTSLDIEYSGSEDKDWILDISTLQSRKSKY